MMTGAGNVVVVMATAGTIVPLYDADAVTPFASVALTVKEYEPDDIAVPLIAPVTLLIDRPAGNPPAVTVNVIGAVPPVVAIVCA